MLCTRAGHDISCITGLGSPNNFQALFRKFHQPFKLQTMPREYTENAEIMGLFAPYPTHNSISVDSNSAKIGIRPCRHKTLRNRLRRNNKFKELYTVYSCDTYRCSRRRSAHLQCAAIAEGVRITLSGNAGLCKCQQPLIWDLQQLFAPGPSRL